MNRFTTDRISNIDDIHNILVNPLCVKAWDVAELQKAVRYSAGDLKLLLEAWMAERDAALQNTKLHRQQIKATIQKRRNELAAVQKLVVCGPNHIAALRSDGTVVATGNNDFGQCNVQNWNHVKAICAGSSFTAGLCNDGSVVTTTKEIKTTQTFYRGLKPIKTLYTCELDTKDWSDIVEIAYMKDDHFELLFGLRKDGTIVVTGSSVVVLRANGTSYTSVSDVVERIADWNDIVSISAKGHCFAGLTSNGTLYYIQNPENRRWCETQSADWKNVSKFTAGYSVVGLDRNGTEVVTLCEGEISRIKPVESGRHFIDYSTASGRYMFLNDDGTVTDWSGEFVFPNQKAQNQGRDIIFISENRIAALSLDGTVSIPSQDTSGKDSYIRRNDMEQQIINNVSQWKNIVALFVPDDFDSHRIIGLRQDGTVVLETDYKGYDVSNWKLFSIAENFIEEQQGAIAAEKAAEKKKIDEMLEQCRLETLKKEKEHQKEVELQRTELLNEKARLSDELGNLKGLFSGKRRKEINLRLSEIEALLVNMR